MSIICPCYQLSWKRQQQQQLDVLQTENELAFVIPLNTSVLRRLHKPIRAKLRDCDRKQKSLLTAIKSVQIRHRNVRIHRKKWQHDVSNASADARRARHRKTDKRSHSEHGYKRKLSSWPARCAQISEESAECEKCIHSAAGTDRSRQVVQCKLKLVLEYRICFQRCF